MICPNGHETPAGHYCRVCGAPLEGTAPVQAPPARTQRRGRFTPLIISIVILALLFSGVGLLISRIDLNDNSNKKARPYTANGKPFVIDARANSIQTSAGIEDLSSITLQNLIRVLAHDVTVTDSTGARFGPGTLVVEPRNRKGRVTIRGSGLTFSPELLTLSKTGPGLIPITASDTFVISASLAQTNFSLVEGSTIKAAYIEFNGQGGSRTLKGPVTIVATKKGNENATVAPTPFDPIRWIDPPATLRLSATRYRSVLSWAGSGSVTLTAERRQTSRRAGVLTSSMTGTYERASGALDATGLLTQLFDDGKPLLRTTAGVDVFEKSVGLKVPTDFAVFTTFDWAPYNSGEADMCITRIRPVSDSGHWVRIGLATLPPMSGAEAGPSVGGITTGLIGGSDLRSVLPPHDADRRSISIVVPKGTRPGTYEVVLELIGNFSPVRVTVSVTVT